MTTFYPGPSQIYPQIAGYMQDAFDSGILLQNHRSEMGMALVKETTQRLYEKLNIPADYHIYFTTSGTECWEIISQSIPSENYVHYINGGFGEKWYEYSKKLALNNCTSVQYEINEILPDVEIKEGSVVCLTQNETSNGTQITMSQMAQLVRKNSLVAVDTVSSMAGIEFNWQLADIWLSSVQKCFGLPAGLGIMVCSPKALEMAKHYNLNTHYNSLLNIHKNMELFQTINTPNILGIYLLNKVLQQVPNIAETSTRIKFQAKNWYNFFENNTKFKLFCTNKAVQSDTVIVLEGEKTDIIKLKQKTEAEGLILGNGYGKWQENTFRIANFPAIEPTEIDRLMDCISKF
jgi:phosphoserine aminotransferase